MAFLNTCMKSKNYFRRKTSFEAYMKMTFTKIIANMSQGPPNSEFRSDKVKN